MLTPRDCIIAQSKKIRFEEVMSPDGNPLGKINAITQDKLGFMWFSDESNGMLVRFDGSHMEFFRHDPDNPNSPGGTFPHALDADPSGAVWIGYIDAGLDRFDPYTNTFTHYRHNPEDPESLANPNNSVAAVLVDRDGMVWAGTGKGVSRLDPSTGKFTNYQFDEDDPNSLSSNVVRTLYQDHNGTVWVGTGFPYFDPENGGLNRFHPETGTFTRYRHDPNDPTSLAGNKVTAMLEDSSGNFWVGTNGDGLQTLDRETGRFTRYPYDPENPGKLSRPAASGENWSFVKVLLEDSTGGIWIGSNDNGINRYDPETGRVTHLGKSAKNSGQVFENEAWNSFMETSSAWSAHAGQEGLIWLSSEKDPRLFKIDLFHNTFHKIREAGIRVMLQETPGILWKGTEQGLVRQDLEAGTEMVYRNRPDDSTSISSNVINSIRMGQQGQLLIGTANGGNILDPDSGKFRRYLLDPEDQGGFGPWVYDMLEDTRGTIWVAMELGVARPVAGSGQLKVFRGNPRDSTQAIPGWVDRILEDPQGRIWMGGAKITRYNSDTELLKSYPFPSNVSGLLNDSEGNLWVGSDNGLYAYDPDQDQFKRTGLNAKINRIIIDGDNRLWTHNPSGLVRYDPETGQTTLFGLKYGVRGANNLNPPTPYRSEDGTLFFFNREAYYRFNPDEFWQSTDTSRVYATELVVSGSAGIPESQISLLDRNAQNRAVTLNANQNAFSLWYSAIDFHNTGRNQIQYMLEGYDSDWLPGSAEFPANYARVPPGTYSFRVKAQNSSSGLWSENRVPLKVLPPWWATWWAYAAYAALFAFGLWLLHRYQRERVLRLEREKAQKIKLAHAEEITQAYAELKAAQTQLIHSEKMASLGELTAGIAHEIQNPLNFVNNFSEVSREMLQELLEEMKKGDVEEAESIAKDIVQNLDKINHHGNRAGNIVRGMLQHSRSSDGKKEPTDLNALADEYIRLAYHGLRAKDKTFNASMETDFDPDLPRVEVVPQEIGRIVLNLITNAFYAVNERRVTEPEEFKPTVWVRTRKTKDGVEISVQDNGNGIPDKIKDKIFQPFFTTKPTGEGTGLGLSMSYDIAKAHRGDITVKSKAGEGTIFTVKLPV